MIYVSYLRVSTKHQGAEGLGIEAQRTAVANYLGRQTEAELLKEFVEVETGKGANAIDKRPQLRAALELCRRKKATLVIASLDRLARNVHFVTGLMESKVAFLALDVPGNDPMSIQIYSVVAEQEARKISERVKVTLREAKKRGVVLGNPRLSEARAKAIQTRVANADAFAQNLLPVLRSMIDSGIQTLSELARVLEVRGFKTPSGGTAWTARAVKNLLQRGSAHDPTIPSRGDGSLRV